MSAVPGPDPVLEVAAKGSSLAVVRGWLEEEFDWLAPDVLIDAKLLFNELMSNSLRHAGVTDHDVITISARAASGTFIGAVCDSGSGFDAAEAPPGWGLYLIGRAASRWQLSRDRGKTCVEFELELPRPS